MKQKKAQTDIGIGTIMTIFIVVLVGVILLQAAAQSVGTATTLSTFVNHTVTSAASGSSVYLTDYKLLTVTDIRNGTTGAVIPASNYTVTNNVVYNGALAVQITSLVGPYDGETWAINGVAQRTSYIADGGGRALASLIVIMFALAIAVIALYPVLSSKILSAFGK